MWALVIQLVSAVTIFIIDLIRRKWEQDKQKEAEYEYLEKEMWKAIKDRDTPRFFNLRAQLLKLREERD